MAFQKMTIELLQNHPKLVSLVHLVDASRDQTDSVSFPETLVKG